MSTLKYKASDRYALGWNNVYDRNEDPKLNQRRKTGLEQVPTETLRNIWMARFGARAVLANDLYELRGEDIADVAQELVNRRLIRSEQNFRADEIEVKNYFVLEREDGNH